MDVITVEGLTKSYGKRPGRGRPLLLGAPGEVFGYLGPNGAGKTTTIRTMLDFIRPTRGGRVFGLDARGDGAEIHRRVGYLPGEIGAVRPAHRRASTSRPRARSGAASTCGRFDELAERLDLDLAVRIRELSHGNKQKVALIQAFMHRPELLVLDEPTQGLDPLVQQEFYAMIDEARAAGGRCSCART